MSSEKHKLHVDFLFFPLIAISHKDVQYLGETRCSPDSFTLSKTLRRKELYSINMKETEVKQCCQHDDIRAILSRK